MMTRASLLQQSNHASATRQRKDATDGARTQGSDVVLVQSQDGEVAGKEQQQRAGSYDIQGYTD